MKKIFNILALMSLLSVVFIACEKEEDEGNEMHIDFKNSTAYIYSDTTIAGGTAITIGVEAETEKVQDPIIKFNISESVNGAASSTVYSEDLGVTQYEYDFNKTLGTNVGDTYKYTFTITNKDGLNEQESLTVTVK